MASIYLTKEAFDKISLEEDSLEFKIITRQHDVYLDMSNEQILDLLDPDEETMQESPSSLFEFQQEFHTIAFKTGKSIFDNVRRKNYDVLLDIPNGIFIFDVDKATADSIKNKYGVICMSSNDIDFSVLTKSNTIYLEREKMEYPPFDEEQKAEHYNINQIITDDVLTPCNTFVIIDKYIFKDDKEGKCLVEILSRLIPKTLKESVCHVLIIFDTCCDSPLKKEEVFRQISTDIQQKIAKIHDKNIVVEFLAGGRQSTLFGDMHNRNIISNYCIISAEHGLSFYDNRGRSLYDQKVSIQGLYSDGLANKSHSPEHGINLIRRKVINIIRFAQEHFSKDLKKDLEGNKYPEYRFSQDGKCNPVKISPKDIKNRLVAI